MWWFSTPWHHKKYIDEVFMAGHNIGFGTMTVEEVFFMTNGSYKFCGMEILPAFICHDVMKNPNIENDFIHLQAHLKEFAGIGN
ncbi:unnamed protein product [Rotaria magnacalcarata]|uniref:Uncharacterized protein n=1 Tax=Rotaria magnacalcarata TaxID=392030 RepID=A0A8S2J161_9BILA|nr:unnamed protein product [Rotaria magnacalcarata]